MDSKRDIDLQRVPQHVAIIMDGNGRWAKERGQERIYGHQEGVDSVDKVMEAAAKIGVKYITLYAFSTENWNRPEAEVSALMEIFASAMVAYLPKLKENNVRLRVIGDLGKITAKATENFKKGEAETADCTGLTMILCVSYSSRWEMVEMAKRIARQAVERSLDIDSISEQTLSDNLCTAGIPDPDLLIRTSGEQRISNFLMYQLSYSELYFTSTPWPDFKEEQFYQAIIDYQKRERRFGKTSEQVCK